MLTAPRDPASGEKILPWAKAVNALLRRLIPCQSPDILPDIGTNGTTYRLKARGAPSDTSLQFFQLVNATTYDAEGTPTYKIRVVRSVFDGNPPDFPNADSPFANGDDPPCIFTVQNDGVLFGKATIDQSANSADDVVTEVEFDFATSKPDDASDNSVKYISVGSWHIDTDSKTLSVSNDDFGPITVEVCPVWYSTDDTNRWTVRLLGSGGGS